MIRIVKRKNTHEYMMCSKHNTIEQKTCKTFHTASKVNANIVVRTAALNRITSQSIVCFTLGKTATD